MMKIKKLLKDLETITLLEIHDKDKVHKFFVSEYRSNKKEYKEIVNKEICLIGIYDNRMVIYIHYED